MNRVKTNEYTADTSKVARKMSGELAQRTNVREHRRIPKFDAASIEVPKVYPVIILAQPQLGENIGACARAMKNFNLSSLRIVSPRDGWPNPKADSASVGAVDLIKCAKIFASLGEAIADLEFVYATTGIKRNMNKPHVMSKNLTMNFPYESKVGIIFGRENWGLNNEEISLSNKIITIDTNKDFTSLNIAQAVLVVCYELFKPIQRPRFDSFETLATSADLQHFHDHLFKVLDEASFFKVPEKKEQMRQQIINIFTRIDKLSRKEVQILRGIVKSLEQNTTDRRRNL